MKIEILVLLFSVVTTVAIAARMLRIPFPVALVAAGLGMGALHITSGIHLSEDLLFSVFLPGLIFEAAFHMNVQESQRDWPAIVALSTPGVLVAGLASAAILVPTVRVLGLVRGFGWMDGLIFGAVVAATDPIAVVGLFRTLGAPKRLTTLVEAESLLNDGTGIVFFTIAAAASAGARITLTDAAVRFGSVVAVGLAVGAALGLLLSWVIQRIDDPMIEITLTVISAYGSFGIASDLGGSGVISTVVAGLLCARFGSREGMNPATRVAVSAFWEYVAFAMNAMVFLLIGMELNLGTLWAYVGPIAAAYVAMTLARALVVYGVTVAVGGTEMRWPWTWAGVLSWSGIRGALSMVLVFSLALDTPNRSLLINMTFGVVVVSIVLQGLTMPLLLRKLGITQASLELLA